MTHQRDISISWLLYSIRETIGMTIVRNTILKEKIEKNEIFYGKTFGVGDTFEDIYEMVYDFEKSNKRFLIFTSNGEIVHRSEKRIKFSSEMIESHYVSFILDKYEGDGRYCVSTVTIIDPSRNEGEIGIYNPYIGICLEPFFEKNGYKIFWIEMTSPCQINYHDVFCQSWTLYLLYELIKDTYTEKIYIPKNQCKKYALLLEFFKDLLSYEIFQKELKISYLNNIKDHDLFQSLKEYDPCKLLSSMIPSDMDI